MNITFKQFLEQDAAIPGNEWKKNFWCFRELLIQDDEGKRKQVLHAADKIINMDVDKIIKIGCCSVNNDNIFKYLIWDFDVGKSDQPYKTLDEALVAANTLYEYLEREPEIRLSTSGNGVRATYFLPEGVRISNQKPESFDVSVNRKIVNSRYTGLLARALNLKCDSSACGRQLIWLYTAYPKPNTFKLISPSIHNIKHDKNWLEDKLQTAKKLVRPLHAPQKTLDLNKFKFVNLNDCLKNFYFNKMLLEVPYSESGNSSEFLVARKLIIDYSVSPEGALEILLERSKNRPNGRTREDLERKINTIVETFFYRGE